MKRTVQKKVELSKNVKLFYIAVAIIILGYIILSIGDANSFTSLTLGPIILVVGYLVAIPVALLAGVRKTSSEENQTDKNT